MLLRIHPETPQPRLLEQVEQILSRDGVVVYPTETGYAVGASAGSPKALARLYRMTDPNKSRVMALLFHDFSQIATWAEVSNAAFRCMKPLMPGAYTFILPARHRAVKLLGVKRAEVGVRMPPHPVLRGILERHEHPLVSAAARFSERIDELFAEAEPLHEQYGRNVDLVVDSGEIPVRGTTIVSLLDDTPRLVRTGIGALEPLGLEEP